MILPYLIFSYFIIFSECHRERTPHQGAPAACRTLVPGPAGMSRLGRPGPDPVTGAVSHPAARIRRTAPTARPGRGRSLSREGSPGHGCYRPCPPRTPPAHPRTLPAARRAAVIFPGPSSARHGMQRERGAAQPHALGFAARHGRPGTPRQRLLPGLPALLQSHAASREIASPGPAGGMEPLTRVSAPVPSKTPNLSCEIVCTHLPPVCPRAITHSHRQYEG